MGSPFFYFLPYFFVSLLKKGYSMSNFVKISDNVFRRIESTTSVLCKERPSLAALEYIGLAARQTHVGPTTSYVFASINSTTRVIQEQERRAC